MKKIVLAAALLLAGVAAGRAWLWPADDAGAPAAPNTLNQQQLVARGAYLARAGNCMTCHTVRGGAAYAGGALLQTPFGAVAAPNITSDRQHGIGDWSGDDFWRALHNGKSRDGRLLYPAFPYTSYTRVRREDSDALYAYLQSVPAQNRPNTPHALRFPYNTQLALAAWRALYFRPGVYQGDPGHSVEWNRGAYLVQGLGHCSACHSSRNALGGSDDALAGGMIPMLDWYAPSLVANDEAGLGDWPVAQIVQLLQTGVSPHGTTTGPMAAVVRQSLQHLDSADMQAMAVYLQHLPASAGTVARQPLPAPSEAVKAQLALGEKLYDKHCASCHQADGGGAPGAYPPLAGNRAVTTASAVNAVRTILNGGFAPGTAGNPRPYGMPPFSHALNDAEVAAVATYIRAAWGNHASEVSALEVNRYRNVPLE